MFVTNFVGSTHRNLKEDEVKARYLGRMECDDAGVNSFPYILGRKCYQTVGRFCSLRNYTALLAGDGFGAVAASGDGVC